MKRRVNYKLDPKVFQKGPKDIADISHPPLLNCYPSVAPAFCVHRPVSSADRALCRFAR
jgi:hypothetical protein